MKTVAEYSDYPLGEFDRYMIVEPSVGAQADKASEDYCMHFPVLNMAATAGDADIIARGIQRARVNAHAKKPVLWIINREGFKVVDVLGS